MLIFKLDFLGFDHCADRNVSSLLHIISLNELVLARSIFVEFATYRLAGAK